jgi:uroporphyrinogen-III decarboxylase
VTRVVHRPISTPEDWDRIRPLDITAGTLGRELDHLQRLVSQAGPDTPVLATVFSPLTIAKKLCPDGFLIRCSAIASFRDSASTTRSCPQRGQRRSPDTRT